LFIVKPQGSTEEMVDMRGAAYEDLPNAFKYRTSYDAACTCKGQPWDVAARDRHKQYAASAAPAAGELLAANPAAQTAHTSVAEVQSVKSRQQVAALDPAALAQSLTPPQASDVGKTGKKLRAGAAAVEPGKPAAGKKAPGTGVKAGASVKVAHSTVVVRSAQRTVLAQLDAPPGGQRSFRSGDYWRLSVWDHN
jgi:hypothetical protein